MLLPTHTRTHAALRTTERTPYLACQCLHGARERSTEQHRLSVRPHVVYDSHDLRFKSHVKHTICLVHDKVGDSSEVSDLACTHTHTHEGTHAHITRYMIRRSCLCGGRSGQGQQTSGSHACAQRAQMAGSTLPRLHAAVASCRVKAQPDTRHVHVLGFIVAT